MEHRIIFYAVALVTLSSGCKKSYLAEDNLGAKEYEATITKVAPYVIKKPDEFSYEDRFKSENRSFYERFIQLSNGRIIYYLEVDSASLFLFEHKDLTSLFEHYRALGGYYKTNEQGDLKFVNVLFHTPRLTRQEMDKRALELFTEMVLQGNVKKYYGNKKYIDTPNNDFYYNTTTNRWDYTPNSSWKFLEEAKHQADSIN